MGFKFLSKNKIALLPRTSGVYALKNEKKILYIGKAGNIRERIKNHFGQPVFKDNLFINQVKKIGYFQANSEIEALLLEAKLIKKYKPRYNVVWRDDKNYFFVGVTKEDFPTVFITHQMKDKSNIKYAGPFVDGKALKQTLKILRKIFPYRSCKTLAKHPCLWYQLKRCPAPCLLKTNLGKQLGKILITDLKKECQKNVKNLIKILEGKKSQVLKRLKREMKKASSGRNFEGAGKIRDQIAAFEKIISHARPALSFFDEERKQEDWFERAGQKLLQKILKTKSPLSAQRRISRIEAYDISNIQGKLATGSLVTFINGQPDKNFYRKFKIKISGKPNDIIMIKECLIRRLKHREWPLPDLILIDGGRAQLNAARQCLDLRFKEIRVTALAKKRNELYVEEKKKPIALKSLPLELSNLILHIRDEAHRFALTYHRKLREIDLRKGF